MKEEGRNSKKVLKSPMERGMVVLLVLMTFVLIAIPATAQPVKVWVNAPEYVAEGGIFDVAINVDKIKDFKAGQFDISFNSSVVNVTDVEEGSLQTMPVYTTVPVDMWEFVDKDTIRVTIDIQGVTGVTGRGYLAKIKFEVKGMEGDRSALNISNVILYNCKGEEIQANWSGDQVTVVIPEVKVKVNAPEYVVEGETFDVTIDVDNITNFVAGIFDLSFNSSVIVVTDVEVGRLDGETIPVELWWPMNENTIRVLLVLPVDKLVEGVNGSGYLAKICFQVVGEEGDECMLDISNGELYNSEEEEILTVWIDTKVRIVKGEPEPTPTPPVNRVHNLNTSENFSSIQAVIDDPDTKDGHVIEVEDGAYYENVKVTKSLTIQSKNGSASCIIKAAKGNEHVFEITADHVDIRGFTVNGALARGKAGIYLNASHCIVSNNNCSDNNYGIRLEGAHNNSISNNDCYSNTWDGISLRYSNNNSISNNNCTHNHYGYDIHLNESNNNNISNNICSSNNWESGIYLEGANNNCISNNNCFNNHYGYGVHLDESNNNSISNNNCTSNEAGIYLDESNTNWILNNNCSNNEAGICLDESNTNRISHNNCSSNNGYDILFGGDGIHLDDSNNNSISNNNCLNNEDDGIYLSYSNNNSITNNSCSNNKNNGVCLEGANSNCLSNNNCYNNENGIHLEDSNNNRIMNIKCTNNEADGFHLLDSNNNIISNSNCSNNSDGIYLKDSNNNHISNNNCFNNSDGICLSHSNKNSISNNNCSSNNGYSIFSEGDGIHLFDSNNNSISKNNCTNNEDDGIHLGKSNKNSISKNNCSNNGAGIFCWFSNSNNLTGNVMVESGIQIEGDSLSDYMHEIDGSNIVNGKPVYYWKDREGGRIPDGAGQVILVNCSNVIIENQNLNNASIGIEVAFSSFITIKHNNLNNAFGIHLKYSNNNSISNNNCSNDEDGIYLWNSKNNNLTGNLMLENGIVIIGNSLSDYTHEIDESNTVNGKPVYYWKNVEGEKIPDGAGQVILVNCSNIVVENQNLNNASIGIEAAFSSYITIENNTCSSNNEVGIRLYNSSVNSISKNNCSSNKLGIYLSGDSNNNLIYFNNFVNNTANVYSFGRTNVWNSKEKITYTYNETTYTNYLGNYWSDYRGKDTNKAGIGDAPYYIGWWEKDSYPLMLPFENYFTPAEDIFETGTPENPDRSFFGIHNGTIMPIQAISMSNRYTSLRRI